MKVAGKNPFSLDIQTGLFLFESQTMRIMKEEQKKEKTLEATGRLHAANGYGRFTLGEVAQLAGVEDAWLEAEFADEAGLCHAWLISLHQHAEQRHREILESSGTGLEKVRAYFDHLESWMRDNFYAGCPFTRTINSLGHDESPEIRREVAYHKEFLLDFFVILSREFTESEDRANALGWKLFLLYSAATTEAKNLQASWPIQRARAIAMDACKAMETDKRLSVDMETPPLLN